LVSPPARGRETITSLFRLHKRKRHSAQKQQRCWRLPEEEFLSAHIWEGLEQSTFTLIVFSITRVDELTDKMQPLAKAQ